MLEEGREWTVLEGSERCSYQKRVYTSRVCCAELGKGMSYIVPSASKRSHTLLFLDGRTNKTQGHDRRLDLYLLHEPDDDAALVEREARREELDA